MTDTNIQDEVLLLIDGLVDPTRPGAHRLLDVNTSYWQHYASPDFLHNRHCLATHVLDQFSSNAQRYHCILTRLHVGDPNGWRRDRTFEAMWPGVDQENNGDLLNQLYIALNNPDTRVYRFLLSKDLVRSYGRNFLVVLQLIENGMAHPWDMDQLRGFLTIGVEDLPNQRIRPELPEGKLTRSDRTKYREPEYLDATVIPDVALWQPVKDMWITVHHKYGIMPGGLENNVRQRATRNYVQRHSGKYLTAFCCAYQASMLKAWNMCGDDMITNDRVINFIME